MKIKFIENKLDEIKAIYEAKNSVGSIDSNIWTGEWEKYNNNIFGSITGSYTSYFQKDSDHIVDYWHRDIVGYKAAAKKTQIALLAYPYPTLFLKCSNKLSEEFFEKCMKYEDKPLRKQFANEFVEDLINKGRAEVIKPNPGDLYVISADVIHRANPKSVAPHLVFRCMFSGKELKHGPQKLRRSIAKTTKRTHA